VRIPLEELVSVVAIAHLLTLFLCGTSGYCSSKRRKPYL
jgi:hypothetical protein